MQKMKNIGKYAGVVCAIAALFLSISFVFAENATSTSKISDLNDRKQKFMQEANQRAASTTEKLKNIREEAQKRIEQKREEAQQKIAKIKDEKKKKQAEQIEKQFAHINQVWTDHFTKLLNHYDAVLQKIKTRTDKAAANGRDVSAVKTAIQNAETKIAAAGTAVATQAGKIYTIDVTAITSGVASSTTATGQNQIMKNFRAQFKAMREQLMKDLFALRDGAIKDAKTAVKNALQALSKVPKVDEEPTATSTPTGEND